MNLLDDGKLREELFYSIALTLVPQIGAVQGRVLVETMGSAAAVFKSRKQSLEKIAGIGPVRAGNIKNFDGLNRVERELIFLEKFRIRPLLFHQPGYPNRLKHCEDPPLVLFYRGNADLEHQRIVSIVGTRRPTEHGKHCITQYLEAWTGTEILVVSGLAYGIDHTAHKAALKNGLKTVAVMANGMDIVYPAAHKGLARDMTRHGGLLTEFISGTQPDKQNFPRRNRIVAGLCDALLVVETDVKGGSMITAELASGYNREVFALPGRINDDRSAGCNFLIRENRARLSLDPDDLLRFMNWDPPASRPRQQELFADLGEDERAIVKALAMANLDIEQARAIAELPWPRFHTALLNLEINGTVRRLPGNIICLGKGG